MTEEKKNNLELRLDSLIESVGVQPNLKGCRFLKRAILLILEHPELQFETMQVYEKLAEIFQTKGTNVERNIRYAIADAYQRNQQEMRQISVRPDIPPSNSEMIAYFVDRLRLECI